MTNLNLHNTRSLLDEIERRMGDDWSWEIDETEVNQIGYRRYGTAWENWQGPNFPDWSNIQSFPAVEAIADEVHERKLMESKEAGLTVRRDLRMGILLAVTRGVDGLSDPIESTRWDGTQADSWLLTGQKNGLEIRVCSPSTLPFSEGAPVVSAADGKNDTLLDATSTNNYMEPLLRELRAMQQESSKPDGLKAKCIGSMINLISTAELAVTGDGKLIGPRSKTTVSKIAEHSGLGDRLQPETTSYKEISSRLGKKGLTKKRNSPV